MSWTTFWYTFGARSSDHIILFLIFQVYTKYLVARLYPTREPEISQNQPKLAKISQIVKSSQGDILKTQTLVQLKQNIYFPIRV